LWLEQFYHETEEERLASKAEAEKLRAKEAEDQLKQEREWARLHPDEWAEWVRLLPMIPWTFDFGSMKAYDFAQFLNDVGPCPSHSHTIVRRDEALPYTGANLHWAKQPVKRDRCPVDSPYYTVDEAAEYCRRKPKTLLNHHCLGNLRAVTATRPILFRREDLDEWLVGRPSRSK
jgi:hypothetical protein